MGSDSDESENSPGVQGILGEALRSSKRLATMMSMREFQARESGGEQAGNQAEVERSLELSANCLAGMLGIPLPYPAELIGDVGVGSRDPSLTNDLSDSPSPISIPAPTPESLFSDSNVGFESKRVGRVGKNLLREPGFIQSTTRCGRSRWWLETRLGCLTRSCCIHRLSSNVSLVPPKTLDHQSMYWHSYWYMVERKNLKNRWVKARGVLSDSNVGSLVLRHFNMGRD
jgi:hypothetical protein